MPLPTACSTCWRGRDGTPTVRDDLRDYVIDAFGDPGAILVVDETGDVSDPGTTAAETPHRYLHVERIRTADRARTAPGHHVGDPAGRIRGDVGDLPRGPQRVEEAVQGGVVAARDRPDQPAAVVVDHHRDVVVVTLVGDLVDADTPQPGKPVNGLVHIGPHPRHDRPHGAPGDPHQLTHRGFRTRHGQPGHRVIEGVGMPGMVACPRHRYHRGPMGGAIDPRRIGLQHHLHRAPIQARHRRQPSPRSYQGALRCQRPQRPDTPLRSRTRATTTSTPSARSSSSIPSITVRRSTPTSSRHSLTLRTSLLASLVPDLRQARNLKRNDVRFLRSAKPPTEVSQEMGMGAGAPARGWMRIGVHVAR